MGIKPLKTCKMVPTAVYCFTGRSSCMYRYPTDARPSEKKPKTYISAIVRYWFLERMRAP